jgi:enolase
MMLVFFNCGFNRVHKIGTVTESIEAVKMAKQAEWVVVTSHHTR